MNKVWRYCISLERESYVSEVAKRCIHIIKSTVTCWASGCDERLRLRQNGGGGAATSEMEEPRVCKQWNNGDEAEDGGMAFL